MQTVQKLVGPIVNSSLSGTSESFLRVSPFRATAWIPGIEVKQNIKDKNCVALEKEKKKKKTYMTKGFICCMLLLPLHEKVIQ